MLSFLSILTNIIPKGAENESLNLKNKEPGIEVLSAVIPWALTGMGTSAYHFGALWARLWSQQVCKLNIGSFLFGLDT